MRCVYGFNERQANIVRSCTIVGSFVHCDAPIRAVLSENNGLLKYNEPTGFGGMAPYNLTKLLILYAGREIGKRAGLVVVNVVDPGFVATSLVNVNMQSFRILLISAVQSHAQLKPRLQNLESDLQTARQYDHSDADRW